MKRYPSNILIRQALSRTASATSSSSYLSPKLLHEASRRTLLCLGPSVTAQLRSFSVPTAETTSKEATAQLQKKKNDSNIFLDNLGKIFLAVIAGIIATLVRSSRSTVNRNAVRDSIEESSAIDPVEIHELRLANSEFQPQVYRTILRDLVDRYPHGVCSYNEFVATTRTSMAGLKGSAFTIQLGHLIDRVVAELLTKYGKSDNDPLPLSLWLTILSLPLSSSIDERMKVLFDALGTLSSGAPVTVKQVEEMVGHFQDTCQLPAETQIVATEDKFPTQQWVRGSAGELVPWEGSMTEPIDLEAFRSILRTKSVCAWGECFHKKKM